ncbi:MAG: anthranilate phosphoribosyltransferase [Chromatiales bacterium]|nr:anthranilate phosphoribosyltransferase [Chromatiales bacterium]
MKEHDTDLTLRHCIQKVATGPEYSKDLSFKEAREAMRKILDSSVDPVQAGVFLIALRMKRETEDENRGTLEAIRETMDIVTAPVDTVLDIADPYDGFLRHLPMSPFLATVLAACGIPTFSHGIEQLGPKYGLTYAKVLRAAGCDTGKTTEEAAGLLGDVGWAYVDQSRFCPALHKLESLRSRIVKRPILTTVEVLASPIRGKKNTHYVTGYVHKAYPPIYLDLARFLSFDSAAVVKGNEGGIIPSLKQASRLFEYHGNSETQMRELDPDSCGLKQAVRAVPVPDDLPAASVKSDAIGPAHDVESMAEVTADIGIRALQGEKGVALDSLIYGGAIILSHLRKQLSLPEAAKTVAKKISSGEAYARFKAAVN